MADKLTLKQERFAWEYTRNGGNASQAYRDVYACNGSSADTIAKRAHELRHDGKIAGRIDQLEQEQHRVARLDRNSVLGMLLATYDKAVQCDQTGPAARCVELIGKAVAGGMFVDRSLVGDDTLSREQLIEQLSEGDPHRRKMAESLLNTPRNFEEGANEATRKRFRSTGAG
jgi:hypothetical protein